MKEKIHPEYTVGKVTCACGNTFQVRSTVGDMQVEICSACHPFFTGRQKLVDSAGRVEKFMRKYGMNQGKGGEQEKKKAEAPKAEPSEVETPAAEEPKAEEPKAQKSEAKESKEVESSS